MLGTQRGPSLLLCRQENGDGNMEPEGGQCPWNAEDGATASPREKVEREYLHIVNDWKYLISGPMPRALSVHTKSLYASAHLFLLFA